MVFEQIEKLKQEYTDKFVEVDGDRPELARFKDVIGQVKTINMSGRALVEFLDYHQNIGWYDIALDYLRIVDPPKPKLAATKPAHKPAPAKKAAAAAGEEKKLSPLELARMQGAAKKPTNGEKPAAKPAPTGKKPSTADILAAARGEKQGEAKPAPAKKPSTADILAAARAEKKTTKPAADKKPSTADILAAARAEKQKETKPAEARKPSTADILAAVRAEKKPPASKPENGDAETTDTSTEPAPAKIDKSKMSVADILAAARAEKKSKE